MKRTLVPLPEPTIRSKLVQLGSLGKTLRDSPVYDDVIRQIDELTDMLAALKLVVPRNTARDQFLPVQQTLPRPAARRY